jgi:hypothetical protein
MAKKAILDALSNAAKVGIQLQDLELDKARHLFDLHHDHVEQIGRAQDMGHQPRHPDIAAGRKPRGLNPDGSPMAPPGEGGEGTRSGTAAEGPTLPAAGAGRRPGQCRCRSGHARRHAIPAGDAASSTKQDAAAAARPSARQSQSKRTVKVTSPSAIPDGRASEFHIED